MLNVTTPKAVITSLTLHLDPELSKDISLPGLYESIGASLGVYTDKLRYDCTKIDVSLNIQSNMFETFERRYPGDSVGMIWALSGPKTDRALPDDTVVLFNGFFLDGDNPLPLVLGLGGGEENEEAQA